MLISEPSIDALLAKRELKKVERLIARQLRHTQDKDAQANLLVLRARNRLFSARLDEALIDLHEAQQLSPQTYHKPETLELLGDIHFARFELASVGFADRADTERALAAYASVLANYPDYANRGWVDYQQGRVLLTLNRVAEAVASFQQALLNPSLNPALTAYCYERLGFVALYEERDARRALAFLNKAIDTYPTTEPRLWLAQVYTLRSRVLREIGTFEQALESAEAAIAIATAPGAEGKLALADAAIVAAEITHQREDKGYETVAYITQFLQASRRPLGIDVTHSRAYELLGDAYASIALYQDAIAAYRSALSFNPYHPWELSLRYRIARCYYKLNEYANVVSAIQTLLEVAEKDAQPIHDFRIYQLLANALYAQERYLLARDAYQLALDLAPNGSEVYHTLRHYVQVCEARAGLKPARSPRLSYTAPNALD
jgi:tetratricopeptide (TPR) repeat protein